MDRTIKDTAVECCHYDGHAQLGAHPRLFVDAYDHARRLESLRGLATHEFVRHARTEEPDRFRLDP